MKNTKLFFSFILTFTVAVSSAVIAENSNALIKNASAKSADECVVVIDAGHGNFDGGAVASDGTIEKNLNLEIAKHLDTICKSNGIKVHMIRKDDSSLEDDSTASIRRRKNSDLHNRVALMQKYENSIYISIHMNKFSDSSVHGAQIFYSPKQDKSKHLAESLRDYVNLFDDTNDKSIKKGTKDAFILYNAKCPAVIFECGFISNNSELQKLKDYDYQREIAFSIYLGLTQYFNTKE